MYMYNSTHQKISVIGIYIYIHTYIVRTYMYIIYMYMYTHVRTCKVASKGSGSWGKLGFSPSFPLGLL